MAQPNATIYATPFIGKREDAGKNRAGWIDAMNRYVGIPLGSPYCAAGVSWVFREAKNHGAPALKAFPMTGGSQVIRENFEGRGLLTWDPNKLMGWKGAVGGWSNGDGHGHVFLIVGRLTGKGSKKVVGIETIEFNTDGSSADRDGDGCYRLKRMLGDDDLWYAVDNVTGKKIGAGHKIWFCDTSNTTGGQWW